jgi:hypothetical protein
MKNIPNWCAFSTIALDFLCLARSIGTLINRHYIAYQSQIPIVFYATMTLEITTPRPVSCQFYGDRQ